jgi:probable HAF family extracellular repeat protein
VAYRFELSRLCVRNGQLVDIGPPGSIQASALAINDAGEIVGNYYTAPGNAGPFLYANGKFTNLGQPPGTTTSAVGLNSVGQVIATAFFLSRATTRSGRASMLP